jgi:hypothetical protein
MASAALASEGKTGAVTASLEYLDYARQAIIEAGLAAQFLTGPKKDDWVRLVAYVLQHMNNDLVTACTTQDGLEVGIGQKGWTKIVRSDVPCCGGVVGNAFNWYYGGRKISMSLDLIGTDNFAPVLEFCIAMLRYLDEPHMESVKNSWQAAGEDWFVKHKDDGTFLWWIKVKLAGVIIKYTFPEHCWDAHVRDDGAWEVGFYGDKITDAIETELQNQRSIQEAESKRQTELAAQYAALADEITLAAASQGRMLTQEESANVLVSRGCSETARVQSQTSAVCAKALSMEALPKPPAYGPSLHRYRSCGIGQSSSGYGGEPRVSSTSAAPAPAPAPAAAPAPAPHGANSFVANGPAMATAEVGDSFPPPPPPLARTGLPIPTLTRSAANVSQFFNGVSMPDMTGMHLFSVGGLNLGGGFSMTMSTNPSVPSDQDTLTYLDDDDIKADSDEDD